MFIQSLILAVANQKFTFQIETNNNDIIFTVIPALAAPDCSGAVAQAHAALSVPLRLLTVKDSNNVDEAILSELQEYMQSRNILSSNLESITNNVAEASRAVKQEGKEKASNTKTSKKEAVDKKTADKDKSESAPAQTSTERSTFSI